MEMRKRSLGSLVLLGVALTGCGEHARLLAPMTTRTISAIESATPSDDPDDWQVDGTRSYVPLLSAPRFVVPSAALPEETADPSLPSHNNCAICFHEGRLFLAWRTAVTHFASPGAKMFLVSSGDLGLSWSYESKIEMGSDVREPSFVSIGGKLVFYFFQAGVNSAAFEPRFMWRTERLGPGKWSELVKVGVPGEIPWELKVRRGRAFMVSYAGNHYQRGPGAIDVFFKTSKDGLDWTPVDPDHPVSYEGGLSEVGFELDETGAFFGVGRNEDGDATGFGSLLMTAPSNDLARWSYPRKGDPEIYESPRMFRHGKDLYLIARHDLGGPMDLGLSWLPFDLQKYANLGAYWLRPKRTALYGIDRVSKKIIWLADLPSCGDTSFASIRRMGPDSFLVANYTSPLTHSRWSWMHGQVSDEGTQIYLLEIDFVKR
jgi:hypothetical protein